MKQLNVVCPTCKKTFNYYSSEQRPFCSERCKLIDLGQWLSESYTVPVQKLSEEEQQKLEELHEKNPEDPEDNDEDSTY